MKMLQIDQLSYINPEIIALLHYSSTKIQIVTKNGKEYAIVVPSYIRQAAEQLGL